MSNVPTFYEKVTVGPRQEGGGGGQGGQRRGGGTSHTQRTRERVPGRVRRERRVRGTERGACGQSTAVSDGGVPEAEPVGPHTTESRFSSQGSRRLRCWAQHHLMDQPKCGKTTNHGSNL